MARCYPFGRHYGNIIYAERSDRKYNFDGSLQMDLKVLTSDEDLYDHKLKWNPCGLCTMKRQFVYIVLLCGHTFHRSCIMEIFEQCLVCPLCSQLYGTHYFYPYGVGSLVEEEPREKPNVPIPFL